MIEGQPDLSRVEMLFMRMLAKQSRLASYYNPPDLEINVGNWPLLTIDTSLFAEAAGDGMPSS